MFDPYTGDIAEDVTDAARGIPAVNGGFRAGKRKRGHSLLKRQPRTQTHSYVREVRDAKTGVILAWTRLLIFHEDD